MDDISRAQVCEIMKQITDEAVKSYSFKTGNYNNHCFVTLNSDQQYVIRISRRGWPRTDWKIEKFMRERIAGQLIGEKAEISTPSTHFIDGSLAIIEAVYAIQTHISGKLLKKVFQNVPYEEQVELLQLYGETVRKIHRIDLPTWWEEDQDFAYMKCTPTRVRCLTEFIDPLNDRFDGEVGGRNNDTFCVLRSGSFHRACFTNNSVDCFINEIDDGIRQLHDGKKIPSCVSLSLSRLFHKHDDLIARELGKRNLCHGDYHFGNIMVERESKSSRWQVSGLLDLDLAQVTTPIEDFCKAEIYDFPDIEMPQFWNYILGGYHHGIGQFDYALLMLGIWLSSPDDHKRILPVIQKASKIDKNLRFLDYF